ncbi:MULTISPECIES: tetratricopeptide repeat protein [unclassified Streptomyces]|uniref:tetratricopeptide repeat protein n=1 Tax=unclassified Streptomyces TaxID=2593676 RepID=UPI00061E8011|nr:MULTISPECIES: tetratricopeptide repeat protein [unclassified Streptomyces]KJY25855.1 DNA-binding protein [Streptomyces sp. NRRL S-444]KOY54244.1 DNA-binding protein [Streptomyces sp. XY332]THA40128.1 helix-turn-helix domain-containing protein [Streptomyces sp. A1547]
MDEPAEIGRRVQRMRAELGLTQRALAEPSYTSAYISTLESGKVRPSETALRFLAGRLGTSYEELATGRPAHLATEVRLALTDAQQTLATGDAAEAAVHYRRILADAERLGLDAERAEALLGLGDCAIESGELPEAIGHFEAAERLLADEPLPRRARPIRGRAVAHLLAGELRYACYLLESAIDELGASGLADPEALVLLYAAVIGPYIDMGAHARAAHAAELALALAPEVTDPALVAGMHRQVARTFLTAGRPADADASLAKAQAIYRQLQLRTDLAHCHWMRGYVQAQNGDLVAAEAELRTARDMLSARRAALFTAQVEVELADVLRRLGRCEEAAGLLSALLELGDSHGAVHAGGAHRLLGLMAEERGETDSAEEHYVQALTLLERSGASGDLADLCRLLGDLLRRTGRIEAALDAYRTGLGHRAAPGTTTLGPAPASPLRR